MKIALIVPGGVDRSGEYRVIPALLALIRRLASVHEVHVFALMQEPDPGQWDLVGARIHNIGTRFTRPRAIMSILREHRVARFQVVHSIWSGACSFVAVPAGAILRVPSIVHVAGGELVSMPSIDYGGVQRWRGRVREQLSLRGATVVTAASTPVIAAVAAFGVSAQRLPLGTDLQEWPARPPVRRSAGEPVRLIHVASLNRVKDQTTLLRAVAALAVDGVDFQLDIVGEDILNGAMQALAVELGLTTQVRFHGFLTQRQLRPLVERAHLMIMSSRHEAGPLVMLEAAAVGVPTVGTAVGHICEWSPTAARAVPIGDPGALAAAIRALIGNEELRLSIAAEALRRTVSEDADYTAAGVLELYTTLAGGRDKAGSASD